MGERLGALTVFLVVLAVGAFIGSALSQWAPGRAPDAPALSVPAGATLGRVRVEVLNAGGNAGVAALATERLRNERFDVVHYGNAPSFDRDSSVVLDRVGRLEAARAVADVLGIQTVQAEPDSNLFVDVSVLLGRSWEPPARSDSLTAEQRPWWDALRR